MVEVLVVDDDANKRRKIAGCVVETLGQRHVSITEAETIVDAARLLEARKVDLLLLDLMLPTRVGEQARKEAGFALLKQIAAGGPRLKRPSYILGVTGFGEVLQEYRERFSEEGWQLIEYSPDSEEWMKSVRATLVHISQAKEEVGDGFQTDVAIVTALKPIELEAVLRLDANWTDVAIVGDPTIYHRGTFKKGTKELSVVAAASTEMGMPAAACLTMKVINRFRPKLLAMAGIAAGIGPPFGDILVASQCWDYGSGKIKTNDGDSIFAPIPNYLPVELEIKEKAQFFKMQRKSLLDAIRNRWQGNPASTPLDLHVGPLASGAAVVESEDVLTAIKTVNSKVIGLEMEAYAVYLSAQQAIAPRPKVFAAKSVCDFGKPPKTDEYQRYAAYTSANFIYEFLLDQFIDG